MKDLPLPFEGLALFDSYHHNFATSPFSDLGYSSNSQDFIELQVVFRPMVCAALLLMDVMIASKVASSRTSFNPI